MIQAVHLSKDFNRRHVVEDVTLSIPEGEIFGLVGPDGAGKTTTIRLLCGALRPNTGQVQIAGIDLLRHPDAAREHIGYLAQRFSLYEDLTVLENLRFFADVRGLSAVDWKPRSLEILEFVGLAPFGNRLAGQLSGGMKQKLGLATALVHRPKILLLDEPTTGVDPVTRQDFWQLIIRIVQQDRVAVLVSTPYMDEASRCMRLGLMRSGRILRQGTPEELRVSLPGKILEIKGSPLAALRKIVSTRSDIHEPQLFGASLHVLLEDGNVPLFESWLRNEANIQQVNDVQIKVIPPSLEDVFIAWMNQPREENSGGHR